MYVKLTATVCLPSHWLILSCLYWCFKSKLITIVFRFRRTAHVTPKSYLSFLAGYKTIYNQKNDEIGEMLNRMTTGLEKLVEASHSVTQLSKELAAKEKELAIASAKAEEVLKEVRVWTVRRAFRLTRCGCFMVYSIKWFVIIVKYLRIDLFVLKPTRQTNN